MTFEELETASSAEDALLVAFVKGKHPQVCQRASSGFHASLVTLSHPWPQMHLYRLPVGQRVHILSGRSVTMSLLVKPWQTCNV